MLGPLLSRLPSAPASADEVDDEGDDSEDDQQMNEEAADVHDEESACPENYQNQCE
jgi:hypothetical protein